MTHARMDWLQVAVKKYIPAQVGAGILKSHAFYIICNFGIKTGVQAP